MPELTEAEDVVSLFDLLDVYIHTYDRVSTTTLFQFDTVFDGESVTSKTLGD
jgi:hypothetical protein